MDEFDWPKDALFCVPNKEFVVPAFPNRLVFVEAVEPNKFPPEVEVFPNVLVVEGLFPNILVLPPVFPNKFVPVEVAPKPAVPEEGFIVLEPNKLVPVEGVVVLWPKTLVPGVLLFCPNALGVLVFCPNALEVLVFWPKVLVPKAPVLVAPPSLNPVFVLLPKTEPVLVFEFAPKSEPAVELCPNIQISPCLKKIENDDNGRRFERLTDK